MIKIREFEPADTYKVGILIADTFEKFNLDYLPEDERSAYLGGYRHARSHDEAHQKAIYDLINAERVYLAVTSEDEIVGVVRAKPGKIQSLFVHEDYHRQGIARSLIFKVENEFKDLGVEKISLAASIYAIPFYQHLGYQKVGDIEFGPCFDGPNFKWQRMEKSIQDLD